RRRSVPEVPPREGPRCGAGGARAAVRRGRRRDDHGTGHDVQRRAGHLPAGPLRRAHRGHRRGDVRWGGAPEPLDPGPPDRGPVTANGRVDVGRVAETAHLRDLARLRRVRDRIDREYAQPLDVEALARGAHMSAGHLSREFRLAYGESPYAYLMTRRIERAMALLRRGDLSVTEVCFAVGCSSLGTFSTRFTELVGVPPST